jgi:hypothetical protein
MQVPHMAGSGAGGRRCESTAERICHSREHSSTLFQECGIVILE